LICILTVTVVAGALAQAPTPAASGAPAPAAAASPVPDAGQAAAPAGSQAPAPLASDVPPGYYDIRKFPREQVVRLTATTGYPARFMRVKMEIVDEDAEWVYMRNLPVEDPESAGHKSWKARQILESKHMARKELAVGKFVMDPAVEHPLPGFSDRVHLEERSEGLPSQGRWQMGMAVADMNGDGLQDLVLPPPRLGIARPWVVLQTPTGWRPWEAAKWPDVKLDYGDVKVADFDRDGNLDIALACHFLRNYVMYGNGKGDFTRVVELANVNAKFSSRAIGIADFDSDGRPDIAALAELDIDLATNAAVRGALLQVHLNRKDGWKVIPVQGTYQNLYGDHLAVGDVDADGKPDIVVSSHKNSNFSLAFLNLGDGLSYLPVSHQEFPYLGYVFGVAVGDLDGKAGDEVLMGAYQNVRLGTDTKPMNGVLVYGFSRKGDEVTVTRQVVAVDGQELNAYSAAGMGDLDGDGRGDLLLGRRNGQVELYVQGLDGQFLLESSPELTFGDAYINALTVMPVGSSGERALVVESSDGKATPGSVRAFVVRRGPLTKPAAAR
jgi:hypothetical protein